MTKIDKSKSLEKISFWKKQLLEKRELILKVIISVSVNSVLLGCENKYSTDMGSRRADRENKGHGYLSKFHENRTAFVNVLVH